MQDDDLEITCSCGRCTVIIRNGLNDLRDSDSVIQLMATATNISCGCGVRKIEIKDKE